jgi:hypothetical protein
MKTQVLITSLVVILIATSTIATAQTGNAEHTIKVEINNNAYRCPNLIMKIKRTVAERKTDMLNWQVSPDYNTATFTTANATICNADSIIKIFNKEAEYPVQIIQHIYIDGKEVYKHTEKPATDK